MGFAPLLAAALAVFVHQDWEACLASGPCAFSFGISHPQAFLALAAASPFTHGEETPLRRKGQLTLSQIATIKTYT